MSAMPMSETSAKQLNEDVSKGYGGGGGLQAPLDVGARNGGPAAAAAATNATNRMSARGTARLFVGQLNFDASEYDVRQIFSFYGHVLHVNILRDNDGKSTGSAFVTYGSTDEADTAIQSLHDHYSMGRDRPLQVSYCRRSEVISDFGYQHAVELRENNKSNPLPPQRA